MRTVRSMLSATALLAGTATTAHADGRTLYVWSGTVDREVIITMRGTSLDTRGDGYESMRDARYRIEEPLPRALGVVRVRREDGRGNVDVVEQPTAFNNFTARIRVRDDRSGADRYRLQVTWEPAFDPRRGDDRYDRGRDDDRRDRGRDDRRTDDRRDGGMYDRPSDFGARRDAGLLRWSGEVDDVAEIHVRGRSVDFYSRSGDRLYNVRYDVQGAGMPRYAVPLDLRRFAGRGNVVIAQYPREWNDWTTVIRVEDKRAGADGYAFDLRW